MRGLPFLLGLPAAVVLFVALSAFLAHSSKAMPFRFARQYARFIWLFVVGVLGLASIPELWAHGARASEFSMFLGGAFSASVAVCILGRRGAFDPSEWTNYPPAPLPLGTDQIRGFLSIDPRISHFAIQSSRRWFGLGRRIERWEHDFAPDCQIPDVIREARTACDERQTYSTFEVDIQAKVSERGRFGPKGWCSRHATILSIARVGSGASTTPGPFLRKLWGLPPLSPIE